MIKDAVVQKSVCVCKTSTEDDEVEKNDATLVGFKSKISSITDRFLSSGTAVSKSDC